MTKEQRIEQAIVDFNAKNQVEDFHGIPSPVRARRPIMATDCDYEIVRISGVQGMKVVEWSIGDRVVIKPSDNWLQPRRGWAERGRQGTVKSVIQRHLGNIEIAVFFDRTRSAHQLEYFRADDLLPAPKHGSCCHD